MADATASAHATRWRTAMTRAVELAARGPIAGGNPQVGCVLLDARGRILAEGWHRGAGTAHAEADALARLRDDTGAPHTAVVTLEPCAHAGRTPPCSDALIAAGVRQVVYAVADPAEGAGGGARLRDAGIRTVAGVGAGEVEALIEPWLTAVRRGRPWTTLKWAQSLDGRAAAADGTSQWITGPAARADAHRRRAEADAILTGIGTVIADDPALTARDADGLALPHQPVPVVVGSRAVPGDARIRRHPAGLIEAGRAPLPEVLADLHSRGLRRVLVEAGPTLTTAVLRDGLADEIVAYVAPAIIGAPGAPGGLGAAQSIGDLGVATIADAIRLRIHEVARLGDDLAITLRPRRTAALEGDH